MAHSRLYFRALRLARKRLGNPRAYNLCRRAYLVGLRVLRRVDEDDLRAFGRVPDRHGLVLDIGANGGQSAIALSFLMPDHRIHAFEPNPALVGEMRFLRRLLGGRFTYQIAALGDRPGTLSLHVPVMGKLPITTRASLLASEADAHAQTLRERYDMPVTIARHDVPVLAGDGCELQPDAIKIDVEGAELQVLMGLAETIARTRPTIMLERGTSMVACQGFLAPLGYRFAQRGREGELHERLDLPARNYFAVPRERWQEFVSGSGEADGGSPETSRLTHPTRHPA